MSLQGHFWLSLKGHASWERDGIFMRTEGNKRSHFLKKGEKEGLEDYKVISLSSTPRKMMEQPNLKAIFRHMKDRKVTGVQSAWTYKGSNHCEITSSVDNERAVDIVYLDFSLLCRSHRLTDEIHV